MSPAETVRLFKIIALALGITAGAEGIRLNAYLDSGEIPTICYGSTTNVPQTATLEECHARLTVDMIRAIETVDKCAPGLPEHMTAAWADAVFNIGPRIVCDKDTSTAARLLASGKFTEACNELPKWNKARVMGVLTELPGLTKRRERNRQLCLYGTL